MSFGKRGEEAGASYNPVRPGAVAPPAKSSGLDKGFIALALGVVVLSAGGAMAAPSLLSWAGASFSGGAVRPIETVIAGLDRDHARIALASEAFPDNDGRTFMASLQSKFPDEHGKLLDGLADKALQGGGREDLVDALDEWTIEFAQHNLPAIGRTGADGFDQALAIASDGLNLLKSAGGGCDVATLQRLASNPADLSDLGAYGSEGYKLSMRANHTLVELAARGRNAPPADAMLRPEDERAIQSAFYSMLQDPQIMSLMQMSMQQGSSRQAMNSNIVSQIDVCQLGRTVVVKLKNLPSGTKSRLWGMALSQASLAL